MDLAANESFFFALWMPGTTEWIVLLVLGLLIFGRRLPEVGRSLGRGIVEFKKGIRGIEDEIEEASSETSASERLAAGTGESTLEDAAAKAAEAVERTKVGGESANPYSPSGGSGGES